MNKFLAILIFGIIFLFYKKFNSKKPKNLKLDKFKNKLQSTANKYWKNFFKRGRKNFFKPKYKYLYWNLR